MLCANLALNDVTNVLAYPNACGATAGMVVVPEVDYGNFDNPGALPVVPAGSRGVPAPMIALDDLNLSACHLLKIDVEGFEPQVLRGAARTIARCRPILYVENDRAENQQTVFDLIDGYGYRMYWHLPRLFDEDNFRGATEDVFPGVASINVLAIPPERGTNIPNTPIDPKDWIAPGRGAQPR